MGDTVDFDALRSRLQGDVLTRDHSAWDEARTGFHLLSDHNPAAIVLVESVTDVTEVLHFAQAHGLHVSPQSYGHQAMAFEELDGAILLKTGRMRGATVDPEARTARVEAGAPWGDVTDAAATHGLAALSGTSPDVGVVGYTLGGGLGWLGREYGFACNSVLAAEVVNADGELIRADLENHPDLFWALRGGGGSFGVVTALEFSLYKVPRVYAGALFWPWQEGDRVWRRWRTWSLELPDAVTTLCRYIQFPPFPDIPEALRGRQFVAVEAACVGDEAYGDKQLRGLRELKPELDTFAMLPTSRLAELHMDPREPVSARLSHQVLEDCPDEAVDAMVTAAGPPAASPLVFFELRRLGGALAVAKEHHGVRAAVEAPFLTFGISLAMDPVMEQAGTAHLRQFEHALAPWQSERLYMNFAEEPTDAQQLFDSATYRRLREVKTAWDPQNLIRPTHVIEPLTPATR